MIPGSRDLPLSAVFGPMGWGRSFERSDCMRPAMIQMLTGETYGSQYQCLFHEGVTVSKITLRCFFGILSASIDVSIHAARFCGTSVSQRPVREIEWDFTRSWLVFGEVCRRRLPGWVWVDDD